MLSDKRILFISHDASRTGAPIVLLQLMNWLKVNSELKFDILLRAGGELEADFAEIAEVYLYKGPIKRRSLKKRIKGLFMREGDKNDPVNLLKKRYHLIYSNTVVSNCLAVELKQLFNCAVICHVHENEFSIKTYYSNSLTNEIAKNIDHFIAVSDMTRNGLIEAFKIDKKKISLCYEFIPLNKITVSKAASEIRKELKIEETEFVVGASGTCSWRKGTDWFVTMVQIVNELLPDNNIRFVWTGALSDEYRFQIDYDMKKAGLEKKVIFTGSKQHPENYYNIFNVFVLTSRDDPFPLVCLEASALSKPVLCFNDSGGMPEFVGLGGGIVVPYGSVNKMANTIIELQGNRFKLSELSVKAVEMVQSYDADKLCPIILGIIQRHIQ